ncbi:MAG: DUF721 domain-containing protein [Planctomycetota bacterium]|nr:MAG: DUF721 domain-containing protein [Planctomycetota bacterium]
MASVIEAWFFPEGVMHPQKPPEPGNLPPPIREVSKLGDVLSKVIAMRGIGRIRGDRQLADAWKSVAGPEIAEGSRPTTLRNGTLQILVSSSALLAELVSFHKATILARLKAEHPSLKVRELKFKLQSRG